jgi:hypothetical protein
MVLDANIAGLSQQARRTEILRARNMQQLSDKVDNISDGSYGSFYDSTDQTIAVVDTPQAVTLDSDYGSSNVSVVAGSKITFANAGVYTLSFVAQTSNLSNDVEDIVFWLKFNGTDYPHSSTTISLPARKSAGVPSSQLETTVFTGEAGSVGDYVEIWWQATSTDVSLQAVPAGSVPEAPSVIVSVTQVVSIGVGPVGPTGPAGATGPQGVQGPTGPQGPDSAWLLIGSASNVTGLQTVTVPAGAVRVRVSWNGSAAVTSQLRLRVNNLTTSGLYSNSQTIAAPNGTVSSSADGASDTKYLVGDFLGVLKAWGTFEIDLTDLRAPVQALAYRQGIPGGSSKMEAWGWLNSDTTPVTSLTLYPSSGDFNSFYWRAEALFV